MNNSITLATIDNMVVEAMPLNTPAEQGNALANALIIMNDTLNAQAHDAYVAELKASAKPRKAKKAAPVKVAAAPADKPVMAANWNGNMMKNLPGTTSGGQKRYLKEIGMSDSHIATMSMVEASNLRNERKNARTVEPIAPTIDWKGYAEGDSTSLWIERMESMHV